MANERYSEFTEETPKSFVQGLFEESSTQKQRLGTIRKLSDGREFVYAQMGATTGVAGTLYQTPAVDMANVANVTVANANVGERVLTITPVTIVSGDLVANTFAEGFVHINVGAANGMAYKVKSHGTLAANTAANFALYDKLRSANVATATSKATLTRHPCKAVIASTGSNATGALVGVATFPVTANYFCWLQKRGPCAVEVDGTVTAGNAVFPAANDGTVGPGANGATEAFYPVGVCMANNANDAWALIDLKL